ncbi:hypothetical protein EDD86DRAFT_193451 [Gorgonomyces haynaldii]|nr:hypothetical protein EDD86DRAFT_193451 [Gorgonomyces haynaldii]
MSRATSATAPSPLERAQSIISKSPQMEEGRLEMQLTKPNQWRAFGRRAFSYQKRQWFTNIFCVLLCPFFMVLTSFLLQLIISTLAKTGSSTDFQLLYCSNAESVNQQQWPVYNQSGDAIKIAPASSFPGAKYRIKQLNYIDKSIFVELTSAAAIEKLAAVTLVGNGPCVQWFGEQYPTRDTDIYSLPPKPRNPYSTKDSVYSAEILDGWLDVLAVPASGDTTSIYARQAFSLARTYAIYQTRPWAIVAVSPDVDPKSLGSVPPPSLTDTSKIPSQVPYFKPASAANGLLDTIEPRWYARVQNNPIGLGKFEQVPYFLTNFSSMDAINQYLTDSIQRASDALDRVDTSAVTSDQGDLVLAQALADLQSALGIAPYGALYFKRIDHQNKNYSYILQHGTDQRLEYAPGFPTAGFRRLLQQAQLSNALLRYSNTSLASHVITQGTRAFPVLADPVPSVSYGGIIGRILYPLGISFLLPVFTILLVKEKESRVLVMLRMNGLGDVTGYYVSNFITFFINYCISVVVFVGAGYGFQLELFSKTSGIVLTIVFGLWGLLQVSMTFLLSSFFQKSRAAVVGVFLVTICGVITSYILDQIFSNRTYPPWLYIWPPFVFYHILSVLNDAAISSKFPAYTLKMVVPGDPVFIGILVMFFETVIALLLSIYLIQVFPGEFGTPQPWYFPFFKSRQVSMEVEDISELTSEDDDVKQERLVVKEKGYQNAPLVVDSMRKSYGKALVVKNVSFAIEKGTVFGLLGPNGAGKTSLIAILTGVYSPSAGSALLGGHDIRTNPLEAYQAIGVCPQFDTLWDDLNVEEHLFFYARLKGVPIGLEREAVQAALELVDLLPQQFKLIKHLSGGQKRRVSIAISLVANPKVVFLDEPTTGLDPEVRRTVWDTIARARGNRAILLTTHSMEEADVCCQRIGIMAKGTMRCIGSSNHLKSKYGAGYNLEISFTNFEKANQFVLDSYPQMERVQELERTCKYVFTPTGSQLAALFEKFESEAAQHCITTWGISQTTLDEIFTSLLHEKDM